MSSIKIAFVFPGQGGQKPGMGSAWVDHPSWELVEEASDVSGRDIAKLLLEADKDELKQTHNSQLVTYIASMLALDAVERVGVDAACYAGHSLGEYSALTAAGSLSYTAGVKLVAERGEAMQDAAECQPGTMAAVLGLEDDVVELSCSKAIGDVWVANYNTPGQVVIAGSVEGIEAATEECKEAGAKKVMPLPVGGAFHTTFMSPARDRLVKAIEETDLRDCIAPVYANVDSAAHTEASEWRKLLAAQLTSPVRWRQSMAQMGEDGFDVFVELGSGKILSGMTKRTNPAAEAIHVGSPADIDALLERLANARTETTEEVTPDGETLYAVERLVISPGNGVFEPVIDLTDGQTIKQGQIIGKVGEIEVKSPFSGNLQGLLALQGEKVNASQPLAWLRIATD